MRAIYLLCGISKQSHHQALVRARDLEAKQSVYVGFMAEVRVMHPGMGLRTMHEHFRPEGIGRDAFIALGLAEGFRLAVVRNHVRTTWSVKNRRYRNLLGGRRFTGVNQVWSSDLFYFQLDGRHYYVVLIMDVYSRRIVGHNVADNMRAENNVAALRMALTLRGMANFGQALVHHSDRGLPVRQRRLHGAARGVRHAHQHVRQCVREHAHRTGQRDDKERLPEPMGQPGRSHAVQKCQPGGRIVQPAPAQKFAKQNDPNCF